jgi:hypothetical protein
MVSKCANSGCESAFRYFRGGKLFLIEPGSLHPTPAPDYHENLPRSEYFWLCERCSRALTVTIDKQGKARVESLSRRFSLPVETSQLVGMSIF